MIIMLIFVGPRHPRTYDEDVPLDRADGCSRRSPPSCSLSVSRLFRSNFSLVSNSGLGTQGSGSRAR